MQSIQWTVSTGLYCWETNDVEHKVYKITDILLANVGNQESLASVIVCRLIHVVRENANLTEHWGNEIVSFIYDHSELNIKYCFSKKLPKRFAKVVYFADQMT
jgi:hypothetical protein